MPHDAGRSPRGFFVTGTDTGVGKTLVSCALLRAYAARGLRVIGMKPVAAGASDVKGVLVNDDVEQLIAASNVDTPRERINPYCFGAAIAPHIAAADEKITIKINEIVESSRCLSALADVLIVEGAGGFCVPLNATQTSADLSHELALPVELVVGMRLGCLNHALLTSEAIRARGLVLAGWIANHIDATMSQAHANVAALQVRLCAPLLARIAYAPVPDPVVIARQISIDALLAS
jgi:dethiobiotin synthetase